MPTTFKHAFSERLLCFGRFWCQTWSKTSRQVEIGCGEMHNYTSLTPYMFFSTDPLRFVQTPKDQTAIIGQSVWFHCAATGSPKPKVTWLKHDQGGRPLDAEKYKVFKNGSLKITDVRSGDSGRYFCIAATRVDLRQKTVHLWVKGKSINQSMDFI